MKTRHLVVFALVVGFILSYLSVGFVGGVNSTQNRSTGDVALCKSLLPSNLTLIAYSSGFPFQIAGEKRVAENCGPYDHITPPLGVIVQSRQFYANAAVYTGIAWAIGGLIVKQRQKNLG